MHHHFTTFLVILVISTTAHLKLSNVEGRKLASNYPKEDESQWRVRIGSRPPRCQRRCESCSHCEAIQVPTNPPRIINSSSSSSVVINGLDYGSSNYKPMSWKCKCGNLFFNP